MNPTPLQTHPENKIYVANLEAGKKRLPPGVSACPDIWLGTIMGERVAVVTTGACYLCVQLVCTLCLLTFVLGHVCARAVAVGVRPQPRPHVATAAPLTPCKRAPRPRRHRPRGRVHLHI